MFNRKLWKLVSMNVTLIFPPIPQIQANMVRGNFTEIFGEVNNQYEYTNLSFHSGGATMESESKGRLHILKDRIQIEERVTSYYGETGRKFTSILEIVSKKLEIQMFVVQINRLAASWDIEEQVVEFLMNRMFRMTMERMKILCPEMLAGVGFKFSGHDPGKGERHDLHIEPVPSSKTKMKFLLDHHFMKPLPGLDQIPVRIDESYDLAKGKVLDFVEAFKADEKSFE